MHNTEGRRKKEREKRSSELLLVGFGPNLPVYRRCGVRGVGFSTKNPHPPPHEERKRGETERRWQEEKRKQREMSRKDDLLHHQALSTKIEKIRVKAPDERKEGRRRATAEAETPHSSCEKRIRLRRKQIEEVRSAVRHHHPQLPSN